MVVRTLAGRSTCCVVFEDIKRGGQEIAIARAAAISQAGSRTKVRRQTPAATRKTRALGTHSRGQTAAADSTHSSAVSAQHPVPSSPASSSNAPAMLSRPSAQPA